MRKGIAVLLCLMILFTGGCIGNEPELPKTKLLLPRSISGYSKLFHLK